ncbi:MAG: hypothetical protein WA888_04480 [Burkholderiaceae bacterium]
MNTTSVLSPNGILALWNDCDASQEAFYEHWYQTEHLPERLGLDGFHRGRRYQAIESEAMNGQPRFFTYYETTSPDILLSKDYIARLNDPTPATRKVMDGVFTNMSRTICQCTVRAGEMRGAVALTLKLTGDTDQLSGLPAQLVQDGDAVVRAELWQSVAEPPREPTAEEVLRGKDKKISACLFVETLRQQTADDIRHQLIDRMSSTVESAGIYRLLCERVSA